jgi:thymidylate synthase
MLHISFNNAQAAFEHLYDFILNHGRKEKNTLSVPSVGFFIENPMDNHINTPWRKWNPNYALAEWDWYLSGNRDASEIAKRAPIWYNMMDENNEVQSNYGWQWNRNDQLEKVIELLRKDPQTRRASISIFDGKEMDDYEKDTPCTYAINFYITDNKLNMQVMMRSNDLILGFCNDQFCFSQLQQMVANKLLLLVGHYHHFVANMHIYEQHLDMKSKYEQSLK